MVTEKSAFLNMKPVVSRTKGTRRPLIACRCLNGAQLAGLRSLSDLVSIPVALGRRGSSSWAQGQHAASSPRAIFLLGNTSPAPELQTFSSWALVSKNIEWDLRWRQVLLPALLCFPGYSPSAAGSFYPRLSRGSENCLQPQQSQGKDCRWLFTAGS